MKASAVVPPTAGIRPSRPADLPPKFTYAMTVSRPTKVSYYR